jgi:hypothetical protein
MIGRKIMLAVGATALMTGPAWALPSLAPANSGTPHNTTSPGSTQRSSEGTENTGGKGDHGNAAKPNHSSSGKSHKCKAHKVGWVVSGALVSQTLTKNTDGSYSGEVTLEIKKTNHHGVEEKGTKSYKVENVQVTFGLADTNADGSVGLDDLKAGDKVDLIGKVTKLAKKCDHKEFTATTTIRKLVFNAPVTPAS